MAEKKKRGGPRPGSGRKPLQFSEDERKLVSQMAAVGIPHEQIGRPGTVYAHFDRDRAWFSAAEIEATGKKGAA